MPGLYKLKPSMISIDVDGRVLRLETFSKAFAPNVRLSIVVAHRDIIDYIILANEVSFQQPSGLSQSVILEVRRKRRRRGEHGGRGEHGQRARRARHTDTTLLIAPPTHHTTSPAHSLPITPPLRHFAYPSHHLPDTRVFKFK